MPHFNGPEYTPTEDYVRLSRQHERVRDLMMDGAWRTLAEIADVTGDPPSSVSAQLRHLRKDRFGAYVVDRRARGDRSDGLYEYMLRPPAPSSARAKERPSARPLPNLGDLATECIDIYEYCAAQGREPSETFFRFVVWCQERA